MSISAEILLGSPTSIKAASAMPLEPCPSNGWNRAFLQKEEGTWKIVFMHSTRVPSPPQETQRQITTRASLPLSSAADTSMLAAQSIPGAATDCSMSAGAFS